PMVSAVKIGGKRLHQLAREGVEVERAPRRVTVYELNVDATPAAGVYRMFTRCSSGTYVRTLAADIGSALGGGAHLRDLRRTAIGSFKVEDARPLDMVTENDVLQPSEALRDYERVSVDAAVARDIAHGKVLAR